VCDSFSNETAQQAHVILPIKQWAEEEGTVTNLEGRVILRRQTMPAPAGVRSDIEILTLLAERLGFGQHFRYPNTEAVFDELRRATKTERKADARGDRLTCELLARAFLCRARAVWRWAGLPVAAPQLRAITLEAAGACTQTHQRTFCDRRG